MLYSNSSPSCCPFWVIYLSRPSEAITLIPLPLISLDQIGGFVQASWSAFQKTFSLHRFSFFGFNWNSTMCLFGISSTCLYILTKKISPNSPFNPNQALHLTIFLPKPYTQSSCNAWYNAHYFLKNHCHVWYNAHYLLKNHFPKAICPSPKALCPKFLPRLV